MKLKKLIRLLGRSCSTLALFGAAVAADPLLTNTNSFRIPFAIDNADATRVSGSAILFASVNGGPMERVQTVDPSSGGFQYNAPSDGRYAFAVRMTDGSGQPAGNDGPLVPELEVVVDTLAPELRFQIAEVAPGEINLSWKSSESGIAIGSMRLEYAEGSDGRWKPVTATAGASGQTVIKSQPGTSVSVRGFVTDLAGNQGSGSGQIVLSRKRLDQNPATSGADGSPSGNAQSVNTQSANISSNGGLSIPMTNQAVGPNPFNNQMPGTNGLAVAPSNNAYQTPGPYPSATSRNQSGNYPAGNYQSGNYPAGNYPASNYQQPSTSYPQANPVGNYVSTGVPVAPRQQLSGSGMNTGFAGHSHATSGASGLPVGSRQVVNNRIFDIDYQVDDIGPSGVSSVELFVTENNGREWFRYGSDIDLQTPFQVDTRGEGTFGFAVRVLNGLGFSEPPPQPGELPTIVVSVDQTAPVAELAQPQVVVDGGGRIRLSWRVTDQNASATPVRLEYAVTSSGPWTPLFDWQMDKGGYEMPLQSGFPNALHFRLLARDSAGNVTVTQSNQPVLIDQKRPTARLLRVQPVSTSRGY